MVAGVISHEHFRLMVIYLVIQPSLWSLDFIKEELIQGTLHRLSSELLKCGAAKQDDQLWPQQLDLQIQTPFARIHFFFSRNSIVGRTAENGVRDVYVLALHADIGEYRVKLLASLADERQTLQVFLFAGAFTDNHDEWLMRTITEDNLRTCLAEIARSAR